MSFQPAHIARISARGQFTIPNHIRTQLGVHPGDRVVLDVENGYLRLARLHRTIVEQTAGSLRRHVSKEKLGRSLRYRRMKPK